MDSLKARKSVKRGIRLLNKKRPGWLGEVKSTKLDLASCRLCVLGQIYTSESYEYEDGFVAGLRILNGEVAENPGAFGFDLGWDGGGGWDVPSYRQLAKIWQEEIAAQRRLQRAKAAS